VGAKKYIFIFTTFEFWVTLIWQNLATTWRKFGDQYQDDAKRLFRTLDHTISLATFNQQRYSWIVRPVQLHKKSICQISERVTKDPRPPLESSREDASKWGSVHFVKLFFGDLFFLTSQKTTLQNVPTPI
jgi:hypothetical protein